MPSAPESSIAFAVVTHNSAADLRRYLSFTVAVAAQLEAPMAFVDNASSDESAELLARAKRPGMEVIENDRNRGYAAAVNQAFAALGRRDVLLLNPDVELGDRKAVLKLAETLRSSPRIGVVAPRLLNVDGTAQASARPFPSPLAMAGHASIVRNLPLARRAAERYLTLPPGDGPAKVDWALGAAMLIRRQAFEAVGGWDESFFLYLEDTDFCRRCAREGWDTVWLPAVALRHEHSRSSDSARGGIFRSRARRAHVRSMVRFFRRYPELIAGRD